MMIFFGHGDNHDEEALQVATQADHTVAIVIGSICLFIALILLSRYLTLHKKRSK